MSDHKRSGMTDISIMVPPGIYLVMRRTTPSMLAIISRFTVANFCSNNRAYTDPEDIRIYTIILNTIKKRRTVIIEYRLLGKKYENIHTTPTDNIPINIPKRNLRRFQGVSSRYDTQYPQR